MNLWQRLQEAENEIAELRFRQSKEAAYLLPPLNYVTQMSYYCNLIRFLREQLVIEGWVPENYWAS